MNVMKVCIVGVGAVGGLVGARLAAAGQARVSAIARGATLSALREHGWRMHSADTRMRAPLATASDRAEDIGPQDLVIVCVKGPAMSTVARAIGPLLGDHTIVLPLMNGVPWWFGEGVAALGDQPLLSVDPDGGIAAAIPFAQVLGGVVHLAVQAPEPGLAVHQMGNGLIIGEPGGGSSARAARVCALLAAAGFDVTVSESVRRDIWYKLWGNLTMNPVSALTGATADRILDDEVVRALNSAAMREARTIGAAIGCPIEQEPEARHEVTRKLGAFKTSMLQDVEAGRPIELDAIVGAVREMGHRLGVDTPMIDALYGLTRLMARTRGLYPAAG
jgi:2-dehydropantoate 2-reductase